VLGTKSDFVDWWTTIMSRKIAPPQGQDEPNQDKTFVSILKGLFFRMYQQGDCITKTHLIEYTDEKIEKCSSPENIWFWSNAQYNVLQNPESKRVAFISSFGTGKTILMVQKATELLQEEKKVVIIVCYDDGSKKHFLVDYYKKRLSSPHAGRLEIKDLVFEGTISV
jgi:hypothetical protein